ncbi:SulP family inorganic anion transporter [Chachezhania sediminis]|uniref:SulP family inorganic anion transporter n=1 Tax=Chachezhania sediminis TaxID=2599291 RepID=UPI00131D319C|nr:SulP family inorganic anion transporter [Chachezhania sediminis]
MQLRKISGPRALGGIRPLTPGQIPAEVLAGLTLAALAIPEVMGYTRISGTPVITGLYTILIPSALFAVFASSRHLVVGADSATAAILASGLIGLAATGTDQYMALAMVLALMVGVLMLIAALLGLGFMADFLSRPVLTGFLTGVGLQVALKEVGRLVALPGPGNGMIAALQGLPQGLQQANWSAIAIAAGTALVLGATRRIGSGWRVRPPFALALICMSIAGSWTFDLGRLVPLVGPIPTGLPQLALPRADLSLQVIASLLPTALAMAVVVLAQSAATARAYAEEAGESLEESTDLYALGLANLGAGLSGSFVVNGSPTKTAMVAGAGGRTQLSLLVMASVVLAVLMFLTRPLSYVPMSVLSGVVIVIAIELTDFPAIRDIFYKRPAEGWIAVATIAAVVLLGVQKGIAFAVLMAIISHTRHGYRPLDLLVADMRPYGVVAQPLSSGAQLRPGLMVYRFTHAMYFANAQQMRTEIADLVGQAAPPLQWFCIDISAVDDVDFTAQATLEDLRKMLADLSVRLVFVQSVSAADVPTWRQVSDQFGSASVFRGLDDLLAAFEDARRPADVQPQ